MKLLVIDDDAELLEMTARRLKKKGQEVVCVSNLDDAKSTLLNDPNFDAVISDYFLENGDNGLMLYDWLRGVHKGMPFVLATGDDVTDPKIEKMKLGDVCFQSLQKPYSMDELIQKIEMCK